MPSGALSTTLTFNTPSSSWHSFTINGIEYTRVYFSPEVKIDKELDAKWGPANEPSL